MLKAPLLWTSDLEVYPVLHILGLHVPFFVLMFEEAGADEHFDTCIDCVLVGDGYFYKLCVEDGIVDGFC